MARYVIINDYREITSQIRIRVVSLPFAVLALLFLGVQLSANVFRDIIVRLQLTTSLYKLDEIS